MPKFQLSPAAKKATILGTLCSVSYLAVYVARNILGAVSPQIEAAGVFNKDFIGTLSSIYFICYAVGQLINGLIGDRVKAKYLISLGLIFAGISSFPLPFLADLPYAVYITYGASGFFLAMIYAPMTKVVAENTEPIYATRCSLGYTFASFFGSPLAGIMASILVWSSVFVSSSALLVGMGALCFIVFTLFEKKGYVEYGKYKMQSPSLRGSLKVLLKRQIVKFTLISALTGVIRTSVVFWLTTFFSEYLGYAPETAASIYTVATLFISCSAFLSVFVYERLNRNMDLTILLSFAVSAISFLLVYLLRQPVLTIGFIVLAVICGDSASTMLWSRYCPSLVDTGVVSSATGFLDFVSYMAAALSSTLFAGAVSGIGWNGLILVWFGLMAIGVIISLPYHKFLKKTP